MSTETSLLQRLRNFGAYVMDDDGNTGEFQPNQLTADAADAIERLLNAGDALATLLCSGTDTGWDNAVDAWEQARRG